MKVHLVYKHMCCALGRHEEFPFGTSCDVDDCSQKEDIIYDDEYTPYSCKYQCYETATVLTEADRVDICPDFVHIGDDIDISFKRVVYLSVDGEPFIETE